MVVLSKSSSYQTPTSSISTFELAAPLVQDDTGSRLYGKPCQSVQMLM